MVDLFSEPSTIVVPPRAGEYATCMADPPWLERGGGQIKRGADRHYPLMKTRDICALPVGDWVAPDAHLYLWVTNNFLPDGLQVMAAWGFRFVTKIDWFKAAIKDDEHFDETMNALAGSPHAELAALMADDKMQVGLGQYFRGCTESCLFGVRGTLPYRTRPDGKRAQGRTGFHAPREEHSRKPEKMRQMVELVSPGPYLELFARRPAPGWDVWGNEAK
jgi:N6-adenosine-specific RNA methylase IME4